jgi:hypothetical protein
MPYFRVILCYKCPKRHTNTVERFYREKDQESVQKRIRRDRLFCYGCEPPKRINPPTRAEMSFKSTPFGFPEFQELPHDAGIGTDYSWKIAEAGRKRK